MTELLNTRDVARMYQVTSATVLNWIRSGKLRAYTTPGGHYRVARDDLEAFSRRYGPPLVTEAEIGLRVLLVVEDADLIDRVCNAIRFRWQSAQIEHAGTEFEVGWWLARLRPAHLVVHAAHTPSALLEHCRQLAAESNSHGPRLHILPEGNAPGLGEWVERAFNRS